MGWCVSLADWGGVYRSRVTPRFIFTEGLSRRPLRVARWREKRRPPKNPKLFLEKGNGWRYYYKRNIFTKANCRPKTGRWQLCSPCSFIRWGVWCVWKKEEDEEGWKPPSTLTPLPNKIETIITVFVSARPTHSAKDRTHKAQHRPHVVSRRPRACMSYDVRSMRHIKIYVCCVLVGGGSERVCVCTTCIHFPQDCHQRKRKKIVANNFFF